MEAGQSSLSSRSVVYIVPVNLPLIMGFWESISSMAASLSSTSCKITLPFNVLADQKESLYSVSFHSWILSSLPKRPKVRTFLGNLLHKSSPPACKAYSSIDHYPYYLARHHRLCIAYFQSVTALQFDLTHRFYAYSLITIGIVQTNHAIKPLYL
jgi:hypothetical protein